MDMLFKDNKKTTAKAEKRGNKMKEKFETAELEIVVFNGQDVITTSPGGGGGEDPNPDF